MYDENLRSGWLTFESASVRKRLAPIPRDWQGAPTERLELMCRAAELVRRAKGRAPLTPDPDAPPTSNMPPSDERPDAPENE